MSSWKYMKHVFQIKLTVATIAHFTDMSIAVKIQIFELYISVKWQVPIFLALNSHLCA